MEKFEAFRPDEETIESWLDAFEARLLCHDINAVDRKRHWCQALVGEAGRNIIKKLPVRTQWDQIKRELTSVLGEANPRDLAFDNLLHYKAKNRGLGEIASDIITKASQATDDLEAQHRLGVKAFISAVPPHIGRQLRRKRLNTVRDALDEARFLQRAEDEESPPKQVMAVEQAAAAPPAFDPAKIMEDCIKQLKAQGMLREPKQPPERQAGARSRKIVCWCCGEEGHMLMQCPTVKRNRAARKSTPDSGNE